MHLSYVEGVRRVPRSVHCASTAVRILPIGRSGFAAGWEEGSTRGHSYWEEVNPPTDDRAIVWSMGRV